MSDNMRGALLMMASMACFTINDTFVKSLSGLVPLFQLLFLRGLLTSAATGIWAYRTGALHMAAQGKVAKGDWILIGLRVAAEVGAAYFFLTALFLAPIATVTAILQSLPLTVTLAAALFFGEPIGWRRMLAIAIGFLGVMLIIQPGTDGFDSASIYVLIAVLFVTLRDLATRRLSSEAPSMLVTFLSSLGVMVFFGLGSLGQTWVAVHLSEWLRIGAAAVMVMGGYVFSVVVMRVGEISFVSPFRYTSLIWAMVLGWFVFGEWPDLLTLTGALIVVSTGIFTLWREGRARRKAGR